MSCVYPSQKQWTKQKGGAWAIRWRREQESVEGYKSQCGKVRTHTHLDKTVVQPSERLSSVSRVFTLSLISHTLCNDYNIHNTPMEYHLERKKTS